jgi:dephospho-CoA kinase
MKMKMTTNKLEIIGLSGCAGSGKDYIFNHHLKPLGYYRWALADHFKIWIVGKGQATYEEVFKTKPDHIRKLLQIAGTEEGRNIYGTDVWLETTLAWLTHLSNTMGINKFCITDVRFPNEVDFVKSHGGRVYRVEAPQRVKNSSLSHEARQHISETALNDYNDFSGFIWNDPQHSETVKQQLYTLLELGPIAADPFSRLDRVFDKLDESWQKMFGEPFDR